MQKSSKQEIYQDVFSMFYTDLPHLFDPFTPKPLASNIKAQLYNFYDKRLSPECIHFFLGKWTNRIEYHYSILKEEYRYDIVGQQTLIEDRHKNHSLKVIQEISGPPT